MQILAVYLSSHLNDISTTKTQNLYAHEYLPQNVATNVLVETCMWNEKYH